MRSMVPSPPRLTATSSPGASSASAGAEPAQVGEVGVGLGQSHLVAFREQPVGGLAGELDGLGPLVVEDEPDRCHRYPRSRLGHGRVEEVVEAGRGRPGGAHAGVEQELDVAVGAREG